MARYQNYFDFCHLFVLVGKNIDVNEFNEFRKRYFSNQVLEKLGIVPQRLMLTISLVIKLGSLVFLRVSATSSVFLAPVEALQIQRK